jgi:hypothetical protein
LIPSKEFGGLIIFLKRQWLREKLNADPFNDPHFLNIESHHKNLLEMWCCEMIASNLVIKVFVNKNGILCSIKNKKSFVDWQGIDSEVQKNRQPRKVS